VKFDRYQRHSLIDWFSQDYIKSLHLAIIGVGAVGNEVIKNMALLGVGKLDIFDFDIIEIHNLTRSVLFSEADLGKTKVETAASKVKELDPNVKVNFFYGDFWESLSINNLENYDAVIACVDNFEARLKINFICKLLKKDLINTGIDSRYATVEYFPFSRLDNLSCFECNLPLTAYNRISERYSCGWLKRIAYIERKIPTTIITSSIAASYATSLALRLGNHQSINFSYRIFCDTISGNTSKYNLLRNTECPVCSDISKPVVIVKSKNIIEEKIFNTINFNDENISIKTSEQIIAYTKCLKCQSKNDDDRKIIFDKASNYDESLSFCKICKEKSVEVIIKDQFSVKELLLNYHGLTIPCKFFTFEDDDLIYLFDLEG
jgi:molybdopterin/thiamine biosynthesis adenylyltransferase